VTPPFVTDASVVEAGDELLVTFNTNVTISGSPPQLYRPDLSTSVDLTEVSGSGSCHWVFAIPSPCVLGSESGLSFSIMGTVEDECGQSAMGLSAPSVDNNSTVTRPSITSATILENGTQVVVEFDQTVTGSASMELILTPSSWMLEHTGDETGSVHTFNISDGYCVEQGQSGYALSYFGTDYQNGCGWPPETVSQIPVTNNSTLIRPEITSSQIRPDGKTLEVNWNIAVTGTGDVDLYDPTVPSTVNAVYASGSGSSQLLYTIPNTAPSGQAGYNVTANEGGWQSTTSCLTNSMQSGVPVTNNSTQVPPAIVSATVPAAGNVITLVFDSAANVYNPFSLSFSGGFANSPSVTSVTGGNNTTTVTCGLSALILSGESGSIDFAPSGIKGATNNLECAGFTLGIVNNSTQ
jgi:hypothetical protein